MKGNLLQLEPRLQERWKKMDLYGRILERAQTLKTSYIMHDGPPYANGPIHIGHLLNKTLKDLVVRSRTMSGYGVDFVPGWDCHGLPIEHKVLKELGAGAEELETTQIRQRCHDYAEKYVRIQSEQLQRLGTVGRYANPYLTMAPGYEAAVLEVFALLVAEGLVYRDLKPVHWSIENRTALADAELEYHERSDPSVYVFFEVSNCAALPTGLGEGLGQVELMIWTTTPWTLPANEAVAVAGNAEYSLVRLQEDGSTRSFLLATELVERVVKNSGRFETVGRCLGKDLVQAGIRYRHPFRDQTAPLLEAPYVTLTEGTGLVHTAPGHGADDYNTGVKAGLPIYCPVRDDGTFDSTVPEWLRGLSVWDANPLIVDHLRQAGVLYRREDYLHSYPHDWRSKTPTIFRATKQWFIAVDAAFGEERKTLRERALEAAHETIQFVPEWGRNRLIGMLESRPDWCISRQRAWGLPIPAFFGPDEKLVMTPASIRAVARRFSQSGSDAWFRQTAEQLLEHYAPESDPDAGEVVRQGGKLFLSSLEPGEDIFDVWFESGSSWNAVLRSRQIGYPADLYLEGSDQHRGWFQCSLLPALGATGQSPFHSLLTHGFVVDAKGRKMSKAVGNTIEVSDLLKQHGADVCRWWVSSLNYTNDIKVDWEFFKVASEEYRKIRNTIRFLLGNLHDFDPKQAVGLQEEDRYSVDYWAMQELSAFIREVRGGYASFRYKVAADAIFHFCNQTLSSIYLAALKDRLYCDHPESRRRRRAQGVMHQIADSLIRCLAPIQVHTAEEAWLHLNHASEDSQESVHLQQLPEEFELEINPGWSHVMALRSNVLRELEESKDPENAGLKNPLDAGVIAVVEEEQMETLRPFQEELADLCGVSRFTLESGQHPSVQILDLREEPRCERSWKRDGTVRQRSDGGWLSNRDAEALRLN